MTVLDRRYVRFAKDCNINKLEEYFNVIFCGDLNSLPNSEVIGLLSNSKINTQ